jgi:hypothetical protein
MANPEVFFDITADGAPVGRILMTVSSWAPRILGGARAIEYRERESARRRAAVIKKQEAGPSHTAGTPLGIGARRPQRWRVAALKRRSFGSRSASR